MFNPFSGWADARNSGNAVPPPSVFGALPYPSAPSNLSIFYLTSFSPDIFNCSILNLQGQTYYKIITDKHNPGYTVLRNAAGKNVALIEWQSHPLVEIRGLLSKQYISQWLRLSADRSSRTMDVRGSKYFWAPRDKSINLYTSDATPRFLARITRNQSGITLELTNDALQLGILDSVVTATLLLQCGRNID
ncbi:hypothetical protein AMATHDRAFT_147411 [Amanita thiersii Skay4041]|uniref:DUF6593 domain-containing protein n=1 Tax=Amanita thiersii Skay4041 TaxID=703135 RepID=A0A2A9NMN1_9AGAR|nr:hypothetical protein AMATHDRAFT_147411 [Amanita thiersii Skay4041]